MTFAAALGKLNASVSARGANVTATIGGNDVPGLFDQLQDVALELGGGGMAVRRWRLGVLAADAGSVAAQDTVTVEGDDYLVQHVDDDGAGWTILHLEPAA
jgi:hypothetical protein